MLRLNFSGLGMKAVILEEPACDKALEKMLLTPHKGSPHEILDDLKNKDAASWGREFSELHFRMHQSKKFKS